MSKEQEIGLFVDEIEKRVESLAYPMPDDASFKKFLSIYGVSRKQYILTLFFTLLKDLENKKLTIYDLDSYYYLEIIKTAFPNTNLSNFSVITKDELKEIIDYINSYMDVFYAYLSKCILKDKSQGADVSSMEGFTNYLKLLNKEHSMFYGKDLISPKANDYLVSAIKFQVPTNNQIQLNYWKYPFDKLQRFYSFLVDEKYMKENGNFFHCFSTLSVKRENKCIWLGQQTHIVYMFYLLYNNTLIDSRITIYDLIQNIFVKSDGTEFSTKGLQTTFSNIEKFIDPKNKSNNEYLKIRDFIKGLNLQ